MIILYNKDLEFYSAAQEGCTVTSGSSFMDCIKATLSQVREQLYEEYLSFMANNGSSPANVIYTETGASYIVEGNDGEDNKEFPLPEKFYQFA